MAFLDILIPLLIVFTPALLIYMQVKTTSGMVMGAVIGIVIGVGSGLIPIWAVTLAVLMLVALMFKRGERT